MLLLLLLLLLLSLLLMVNVWHTAFKVLAWNDSERALLKTMGSFLIFSKIYHNQKRTFIWLFRFYIWRATQHIIIFRWGQNYCEYMFDSLKFYYYCGVEKNLALKPHWTTNMVLVQTSLLSTYPYEYMYCKSKMACLVWVFVWNQLI